MFEDFEPASRGVEKLQELGVNDDDMNVISGVPIKNTILGRPPAITYVSRIGLFGSILGMMFLNRLPKLYNPLFKSERFRKVTHDGYFLVIETIDPKYSEAETRKPTRPVRY